MYSAGKFLEFLSLFFWRRKGGFSSSSIVVIFGGDVFFSSSSSLPLTPLKEFCGTWVIARAANLSRLWKERKRVVLYLYNYRGK